MLLQSVGFYYLLLVLLVIIFLFILIRYLKFIDYLSIIGLFLSSLSVINHSKNYFATEKNELIYGETMKLSSSTLLVGLEYHYHKLYTEFYFSLIFFLYQY